MQKYKLTYDDTRWEATFKVDPTHENYKVLKESIEFFHTPHEYASWVKDYEEEHGDYALFIVWAMYFGKTIYSLADRYTLHGIKEEFADLEGHVKLDGSFGVELIEADDVDLGFFDFSVEKVDDDA